MPTRFRLTSLLLAGLLLPACSQSTDSAQALPDGPNPDQMRSAIKTLLKNRPDIDIPEFQDAIDRDAPIVRNGMVYFGPWNCDPKLMTFEALFSAPNITLYEVSGRFEIDNRGIWQAIPRRVLLTNKHDITEFWRPHEVDHPNDIDTR